MRSGVAAPLSLIETGSGLGLFMRRQLGRAGGLALLGGVAFALAALGTWNVADPSFSHATDAPVTNAMGYPGAIFSDLAMQFFGLSGCRKRCCLQRTLPVIHPIDECEQHGFHVGSEVFGAAL